MFYLDLQARALSRLPAREGIPLPEPAPGGIDLAFAGDVRRVVGAGWRVRGVLVSSFGTTCDFRRDDPCLNGLVLDMRRRMGMTPAAVGEMFLASALACLGRAFRATEATASSPQPARTAGGTVARDPGCPDRVVVMLNDSDARPR